MVGTDSLVDPLPAPRFANVVEFCAFLVRLNKLSEVHMPSLWMKSFWPDTVANSLLEAMRDDLNIGDALRDFGFIVVGRRAHFQFPHLCVPDLDLDNLDVSHFSMELRNFLFLRCICVQA